MKKIILIISIVVIFPMLLFSQNKSLSHSVGIYMGYANRSAMNGMSLQCQYALGVCPHLDVLASVALVNVYDKNDDIRLQVIDGPTPIMSYLSFLDFGVRTYVDFLKICSFKVSGQIGMNTDHQSVLHPNIANGMSAGPIVMIRFNVDAKGELTFSVCPKLDLGIYYEYAYIFGNTSVLNPHIHRAGLLLNLKL